MEFMRFVLFLIFLIIQSFTQSTCVSLRSKVITDFDESLIKESKHEEYPSQKLGDISTEYNESMRSDEISLLPGHGMEETPEFKGGLLRDFIIEERQKNRGDVVNADSLRKNDNEIHSTEGARSKKEEIRVRRQINENLPHSDFVYTYWTSWTSCSTDSCESEGIQSKFRTCIGNNMDSDSDLCSYDNLVVVRTCFGDDCKDRTTKPTTWSDWSIWGSCDITCGKDGIQKRTRTCIAVNGTRVSTSDCLGSSHDNRVCQYSTSCPTWDSWEDWKPCSQTCGNGGFTARARKCVVYRYYDPGSYEGADDIIMMNKFLSDDWKKQTIGAIIDQNGVPIFVVDALEPTNNSKLFNKDFKKERISPKICASFGETADERKECPNQRHCPSVWTPWGSWSSCRNGCEPGFRMRKRKCIKNEKNEACEGQGIHYRRCFPPPCWEPWTTVGDCTKSCGKGVQMRTRTCKVYSHIPPYNKCPGESEGVIACSVSECETLNEWTEWSPYTSCTKSCGRGFKSRSRTCLAVKCKGNSVELIKCNTQMCPTWGPWSSLSCCSATCGEGKQTRTRNCFLRQDCLGKSREVYKCFSPPCNGTSTFGENSIACGKRKNSTQRIAKLKIVNGKKAALHSWPWQGSWQHQNSSVPWRHFCGVVAVHSRWVLTAAHCYVQARAYKPQNLVLELPSSTSWSIVLGMNSLNNGGTRFSIYKIFINDQYMNNPIETNDIALIKLRSFATISDRISPICLPGLLKPNHGDLCWVTGWGTVDRFSAENSQNLIEASVPYVDFNYCRKLGSFYDSYLSEKAHLCAGRTSGVISDTCKGDSGGPLSCRNGDDWYVAGITSFSFYECGSVDNAGIYTNVATHQRWIEDSIKTFSYDNC